jgi:type IV secretory pathway TraG/TraD family ATPase VirD4
LQHEIPNEFAASPEFLSSTAAVPVRPRRWSEPTYGSAHLASRDDLAAMLAPSPVGSHATALPGFHPILEVNRGGAVAPLFGQTLVLSEELRNRHLLLVGRPGSGKTTRAILPLVHSDIADRERSVIVFDPKCDAYAQVAHWTLKHRGELPTVINLTEPGRSAGWTPIRAGLSLTEAYDIAYTLCAAADRRVNNDSEFWINNAVRFLTGVIVALARTPSESRALARIREIVELPRDALLEWAKQHASIEQIAFFTSFLRSGSLNAETVLADLSGRLAAYLDENLCAVTGRAEFEFETLVHKPTVVLLEMSESQMDKLRPIYNLFFTRLLQSLVRAADTCPGARLPRPVSIVFDEFGTIGRVPDLPQRINTLRSRRVSFAAAVQSLAQLQPLYGAEAPAVLAAFNSKVFFASLELEDALYASRAAGTTTIEVPMHETTRTRDHNGLVERVSRSATPAARALLLPDEVTQPPSHFCLGRPATLLLADTPPFQAWMTPVYEREDLAIDRAAIAALARAPRQLRSVPLRYKKR